MKIIKFLIFILLIFKFLTISILAKEDISNKIYKNLRCLVCQGQSIADSNSEFALTIKSVVNDKLTEGLEEEDIYKFMAEKYGDWILYNPPLKRQSFLLWVLPYVFFIISGIILFYIFKKTLKHKRY
tara:strand:+ start:165 stop:545 length:381 start_codon:yes stop_codon:yes gene_type:complete